jgi:hypothetical protein
LRLLLGAPLDRHVGFGRRDEDLSAEPPFDRACERLGGDAAIGPGEPVPSERGCALLGYLGPSLTREGNDEHAPERGNNEAKVGPRRSQASRVYAALCPWEGSHASHATRAGDCGEGEDHEGSRERSALFLRSGRAPARIVGGCVGACGAREQGLARVVRAAERLARARGAPRRCKPRRPSYPSTPRWSRPARTCSTEGAARRRRGRAKARRTRRARPATATTDIRSFHELMSAGRAPHMPRRRARKYPSSLALLTSTHSATRTSCRGRAADASQRSALLRTCRRAPRGA